MPRAVTRGQNIGKNKKPGLPKGVKREKPVAPTWDKKLKQWVNAKGDPICGQPRTGRSDAEEGMCCQPAGWGTDHFGFGSCKLHNGNTPTHIVAAEREKEKAAMRIIYGKEIDISPEDALLKEIRRTAGIVEHLAEQIADLEDPSKVFVPTMFGTKPHHLIDVYQKERAHLVFSAKTAIQLGIAERQVRIAEEQGKMLAMVLQAFTLDPDLELTPHQRAKVPTLLRKHLMMIESGTPALPPATEATA